MLLQLRKKLTLLYTLTTGLILTVVVFALSFLTQQSSLRQREELFTRQLMTIANKLQFDSHISQNWLAAMESDNGLIIRIEENNRPLLYRGSFSPATDRSILIGRAREKALEESIDTSIPPVSTDLVKSSLFTVKGDHRETYQGVVLVFSARDSYFSLTLLKDQTSENRALRYHWFLFLLADLGGILCLLGVSWTFVGKSLAPVRENEKKQQTFIAAASHELRSPLAVILTSADALEGGAANPDYFIGNIKEECSRMSRLVGDMLLLASAKSSSWSLEKEAVDMDTLLLTLFERYEFLYEKKGLSLMLELPETSLLPVLGDRERIAHILSIFLDNAMAYAPKGTFVTLKAAAANHTLTCAVVDHGPGIPDDQKEKVFEYFYRSDTSRKSKKHFGLGLCVAAELARLSGCRLRLSDTPGGGCTFQISFPVPEAIRETPLSSK